MRRNGFGEEGSVQGLDGLLLSPVGFDTCSQFRISSKVLFELGAQIRWQSVIYVGVQFVIAKVRRLFHRTALKVGVAGSPAMIWRRRSRPRESRDITVP